MDRIHGTDEAFRRSKNYDRNIILLGLTSAREKFPDPPKATKSSQCQPAVAQDGAAASEVSYPS